MNVPAGMGPGVDAGSGAGQLPGEGGRRGARRSRDQPSAPASAAIPIGVPVVPVGTVMVASAASSTVASAGTRRTVPQTPCERDREPRARPAETRRHHGSCSLSPMAMSARGPGPAAAPWRSRRNLPNLSRSPYSLPTEQDKADALTT